MITEIPKDLCPNCGKQIKPEDTLTGADDYFYHVDCSNPTLKGITLVDETPKCSECNGDLKEVYDYGSGHSYYECVDCEHTEAIHPN